MRQPTGDKILAGYVRQSSADIVPTATLRAAPINAEYNKLRDAFAVSSGHKHDGSTGEGGYIPLIGDVDALNKVVIDTSNNRVGVFVEVASATVEQVRFQDGVITPVITNDIDLGTSSLEFKDLYLDGTAHIDTLDVDANGAIIGSLTVGGTLGVTGVTTLSTATISTVNATTLNATGTSTLTNVDINAGNIDNTVIGASTQVAGSFTTITSSGQATLNTVDINGGNVDNTIIGATTPNTITGTTITGSSIVGPLTGNVTGNTAGVHTGGVTGNLTGNVTASSGTSTFNDVTVNGTLDVTGTTIANVTDPINAQDAATKNYVDTEVSALVDSSPDALNTLNELASAIGDDANFSTTITNSIATKLPLAGGTMSGAIAMATNKITGLGNPTANQDGATKGYVDTNALLKSGGTMASTIAMGDNKITGLGTPVASADATTKGYVDSILGSATASATSATASATSATASATSATNSANSATASATSATQAQTAETNAETAETNAETSETNASASATTASTQATNASNSASASASSATASSNSATASASSATTATNKAATATTKASEAATSASNASTSATNAATSASSAQTARTGAEAALDQFDDIYLGAKASNPTVDNDGDALSQGTLYFNTTDDVMKVYEGSNWVAAYASLSGSLAESGGTMTGDLGYGDNVKAVFGAGSDLQIYHDGSHSRIVDTGTGNLKIQAQNFAVNNVADDENMITAEPDGFVKLFYNGSEKLSTTATGVNVTGNATFADNGKAIFGAGSDLQIYHDGSNSWVRNFGTGSLYLSGDSDGDVIIQGKAGENSVACFADGATRIYNDGAEKLSTTSSGISVTGNIVVSGTVDGRDLTTDGNKLDGIETGATADQTKSDIEGLGIDVPAANLTGTIAAARLSTATTQAESDDSTKIATTAYVTDKITTLIGGAPSTLNDLNELAAAINDDANYNTTLTTALATKLPLAGGTMTGDVLYNDNVKAIFGAGSDLKIYSDGDNSFIKESGSGQFYIQATNLRLKSADGENFMAMDVNGAVRAYYDNAVKLATTSTGINVTGTAVMDGLTVDTNDQVIINHSADGGGIRIDSTNATNTGSLRFGDVADNYIGALEYNHSIDAMTMYVNNAERMRIDSSGQVGIGTSSPESLFTIDKDVSTAYISTDDGAQRSNTNTLLLKNEDGTANSFAQIAFDLAGSNQSIARIVGINDGTSSSALAFVTEGSNTKREVMRLDSSGNVGIGTSSPSNKFVVAEGTNQHGVEIAPGTISYVQAYDRATSDYGDLSIDGQTVRFATDNGSERMRLDSSGNLLVGTTSTGAATASNGAYVTPAGQIIGRSDGIVSYLNRRSTDGQIMQFMKDGSSIGSISVAAGAKLSIIGANQNLQIGANGSNVFNVSTTTVYPQTDNAVDLGFSSSAGRFKNLYLSGNISVGGTVDGRDIASDGTKLNTIETNADVTDTANVTAAGALMDSEVTNLAEVKAFDGSDYATAAQGTLATNALPKAGGTITGGLAVRDNITIGNPTTTDTGTLILTGSTANVQSTLKCTNGNLHIDAEAGSGIYLNYFEGSSVIFGNGANGAVATMSSAGNLTLNGTVDGVDIAARDGVLTSTTTTANAALPKAGGTVTGNIDISGTNAIRHQDDFNTFIQFHENDQWRVVCAGTERLEVNSNTITANANLSMNNHFIDMNNNNILGANQIVHEGDSNTYMQFHAADQWRVVTGGTERLEVNNSQITSAEPIHAPSFHGDGSALTGIEGVPTGVIVMWSGQTTAIPTGWVLCDGNNNTPNLTNRFIMGAGTSNETTTGGANTRTLATGNIPSHTHSFSGTTNTTGSHAHTGSTASAGAHTHTISSIGSLAYPQNGANQGNQAGYGRGGTLTTNSAGAHTHTLTINANGNHSHTISGTTGSTGSTSGFDNRPAYMALAYIMKT